MAVHLPILGSKPKAAPPERPARPPVVLSAERLFERYFAPIYPPDALADLALARATDANPAANPHITAKLDEIAAVFARLAPAAFGGDDLVLDGSDASVHRLGSRITRALRDAWLSQPSAATPPLLVNLATHGAAYVGACIVNNHGGAWQVRRPLWESTVRLTSRAGTGDLAVFHWWLKALGDEEVDEPRLSDRYRAHVEVPTMDPERLPVIAAPDRRLPRLARVRYDALYKHLRAHLPELRDVGEDFPSAERLDELAFRWLDFKLIGGGRMLLMHGPAEHGVHVLWLDLAGFVKSAFYPADARPEHRVDDDGETLRIAVSIEGQMRVHETLWWGP